MDAPLANMTWLALQPERWPDPPAQMSVSALTEIEACPRRWALSQAKYPQIWEGYGYPRRSSEGAIRGQIVHRALKAINRNVTRAGCTSVTDASFIEEMLKLGGFEGVVRKSTDEVLGSLVGNPRMEPRRLDLAMRIRTELGALRDEVANLSSRLKLRARERTGKVQDVSASSSWRRGPLPPGSYAEIELHAPDLAWKGVVDLLTVSEDGCEIVDFKTGDRHPEYAFQLRAYGLLWMKDRAKNPSGRPVCRLTLVYPDGDESVTPLRDVELASIEADLRQRTAAAIASVQSDPPDARPSAEDCRYCEVRQLCDVYWQPGTQQTLAAAGVADHADRRGIDIEVGGLRNVGPTSWQGTVCGGSELNAGVDVWIRTPGRTGGLARLFDHGGRLRIINAFLQPLDGEQDIPVIIAGRGSEAFLVSG